LRPDGAEGTHSVAHLKAGVCVLALDSQNHVHLTEEFHYGVGRVTVEGVSGGIEAGEDPRFAAERELREELGLIAAKWTRLGCVDPFTASVVSPTELYLAEDLTIVPAAPEGTELIRRVVMPLAEAVDRMLGGAITHAPTCVLLLLAERAARRGGTAR
jgi:ADP-ribose pyrophosphatase